MNRFISRLLLLPLFSLCLLSLVAQPVPSRNRSAFSFDNVPASGLARSVFQLLATNNGVSVRAVHFTISYKLQQHISPVSSGKVNLQYQFLLPGIEEAPSFRDFRIDSLLMPDSVKVHLRWSLGARSFDAGDYWVPFGKGSIILKLPDGIDQLPVSCGFTVESLSYSEGQYQKILNAASLINHYYGYAQLMKSLYGDVNRRTSVLHPEVSDIFIAEQSLLRLKTFVLQHDFFKGLHLSKDDPLSFEKRFKVAMRLLMRMQSLSEQVLNEKKSINRTDKEHFSREFVGISIHALSQADKYQPYIAGSFHEFAGFSDTTGFYRLTSIGNYYDESDPNGQASVVQLVYKYSIDGAALENKRANFVDALLLLKNANLISSYFPSVKPIAQWQSENMRAVDGMAVSYLKVAQTALLHSNYSMFAWYLSKAQKSIASFKGVDTNRLQMLFPAYTRQLLYLINDELQLDHYAQAFVLLKQLKPMIGFVEQEEKSCFAKSCDAILMYHFSQIDADLVGDKPFQAVAELQTVMEVYAAFPKLFVTSLDSNPEFYSRAANIFEALLKEGSSKFNHQQYGEATHALLLAKDIKVQFPGIPMDNWNVLAKQSIVPYILGIIQKAQFEIWAHRLENAQQIYIHADTLCRNMQVVNNPELLMALDNLKQNIESTACLHKQNEFRQMRVQALYYLKGHRVSEAEKLYRNASQLADKSYHCIAVSAADSVKVAYHAVSSFSKNFHAFTQILFEKGFSASLPRFDSLDQDYRQLHLSNFHYPYTTLFDFVSDQASIPWAEEALVYFLSKKSYQQASRYLQLLQHWNADSKIIRNYQKQIIRGNTEQGILSLKTEK